MSTNISNLQFTNSVSAKVDALPNLTPEQREIVREIAVAAALKNIGMKPNLEGIANLVRGQRGHINNDLRPYPTNDTFKANGGRI
jgi:hypothetical protein